MRVVVPYSDLRPETSAALAETCEDFECVFVGGDDTAYWRLLDELWGDGDDFIVVEQDIVVNRGTIQAFRDCPHDWCCAPYPYLRCEVYSGLGCVRFRSEFIALHPNLIERVGDRSDAKHPKRFWCSLDAWIQRELGGIHRACLNHYPVGHLHRHPSHGCLPAQYLYDAAT